MMMILMIYDNRLCFCDDDNDDKNDDNGKDDNDDDKYDDKDTNDINITMPIIMDMQQSSSFS